MAKKYKITSKIIGKSELHLPNGEVVTKPIIKYSVFIKGKLWGYNLLKSYFYIESCWAFIERIEKIEGITENSKRSKLIRNALYI